MAAGEGPAPVGEAVVKGEKEISRNSEILMPATPATAATVVMVATADRELAAWAGRPSA